MKKLVIFSDSLGRPRPDISRQNCTEYEDTYPYLLRCKLRGLYEVDICYIDSLDTEDAQFLSQRMVAFRRPDVVVYHFGINDCAPRIFKKNSKAFIFYPAFRCLTRDVVLRLIGRFRRLITRVRPHVYVSIEKFDNNIKSMLNEVRVYSKHCFFIGVGISIPSESVLNKSWGYKDNVIKYNKVMDNAFDCFVDPNELFINCKYLIDDGIHLNSHAHAVLCAKLFELISTKEN